MALEDPYDAIIVGASFAGLAVARELCGRILLIDRKPIGEHQTSACGTSLWVVQTLGLVDALHQVHGAMCVHAARQTIRYDLGDRPFCTFDYRRFCEGLACGLDATFLIATVSGLADGEVVTDRGRFRARYLVDASGWRAVLARSLRPGFERRHRLSFGVETVTDGVGEALSFWFDPAILTDGVTWMFPIGGRSRVGIGSYRGDSRLGIELLRFLKWVGHEGDGTYHGGFFPWHLREPAVGPLFVVGDAAGQCLPVTGEGIRPALEFGTTCGRIVQRVLDGELTLDEGLGDYRRAVLAWRPLYHALEALQMAVLKAPASWTEALAHGVGWPPLFARIWAAYAGPPPAHGRGPRSQQGPGTAESCATPPTIPPPGGVWPG